MFVIVGYYVNIGCPQCLSWGLGLPGAIMRHSELCEVHLSDLSIRIPPSLRSIQRSSVQPVVTVNLSQKMSIGRVVMSIVDRNYLALRKL